MTNDDILFADDDDELLFADEEEESSEQALAPWKVLLVDDEVEIHNVTKMALGDFAFQGRGLQFLHAYTGHEARKVLQENNDIGVVLLDVVMESDDAGLRVVDFIRNELNNHYIRILLRTGQPGVAPERQTIETYDIDGYLPKAELTSHRLYVSTRTGLKAYQELVNLERHREVLTLLHASAANLHSFEPIETILWNILQTAVAMAPSELALFDIHTYDQDEQPQNYFLHMSAYAQPADTQDLALQEAQRLRALPAAQSLQQAGFVEGGYLIPIRLHRDLGHGWVFLKNAAPDALSQQALMMLGAHAANGLYSTVSHAMLSARDQTFHDSIPI